MIEKLGKVPLLFQPGERWHYSLSVDVQGYLVEKLSGQPLPEFMQQQLFAPLKMMDTAFYVPADKLNRLAEFYFRDKDGKIGQTSQRAITPNRRCCPRAAAAWCRPRAITCAFARCCSMAACSTDSASCRR